MPSRLAETGRLERAAFPGAHQVDHAFIDRVSHFGQQRQIDGGAHRREPVGACDAVAWVDHRVFLAVDEMQHCRQGTDLGRLREASRDRDHLRGDRVGQLRRLERHDRTL